LSQLFILKKRSPHTVSAKAQGT